MVQAFNKPAIGDMPEPDISSWSQVSSDAIEMEVSLNFSVTDTRVLTTKDIISIDFTRELYDTSSQYCGTIGNSSISITFSDFDDLWYDAYTRYSRTDTYANLYFKKPKFDSFKEGWYSDIPSTFNFIATFSSIREITVRDTGVYISVYCDYAFLNNTLYAYKLLLDDNSSYTGLFNVTGNDLTNKCVFYAPNLPSNIRPISVSIYTVPIEYTPYGVWVFNKWQYNHVTKQYTIQGVADLTYDSATDIPYSEWSYRSVDTSFLELLQYITDVSSNNTLTDASLFDEVNKVFQTSVKWPFNSIKHMCDELLPLCHCVLYTSPIGTRILDDVATGYCANGYILLTDSDITEYIYEDKTTTQKSVVMPLASNPTYKVTTSTGCEIFWGGFEKKPNLGICEIEVSNPSEVVFAVVMSSSASTSITSCINSNIVSSVTAPNILPLMYSDISQLNIAPDKLHIYRANHEAVFLDFWNFYDGAIFDNLNYRLPASNRNLKKSTDDSVVTTMQRYTSALNTTATSLRISLIGGAPFWIGMPIHIISDKYNLNAKYFIRQLKVSYNGALRTECELQSIDFKVFLEA